MPAYRNELKYLVSFGEGNALKLRLMPLTEPDPNTVNGSYTIRSLYFDDFYDSAYAEKEMGIFFRKKYRIRIYNYSDTVVHLERKLKQGQLICKESAPLTREEFFRIIEGDYGFLLEKEENLCREFYYELTSNVLRPRVIVDYERTPFILESGTVRVTFDENIRAAAGNFDIFDKDLPAICALSEKEMIMEVKFTEFLPKLIRDALPAASEFTAASKYTMCRDRMEYLYSKEYYREKAGITYR